MEEEKKISYYEERLPDLIQKLKNMVDRNMDVIDQDTEGDLTSDKFFNVLKGRKQAAEDCVWAMKRIGDLEKELSGEDTEELKPKQSWAKRAAQKQ